MEDVEVAGTEGVAALACTALTPAGTEGVAAGVDPVVGFLAEDVPTAEREGGEIPARVASCLSATGRGWPAASKAATGRGGRLNILSRECSHTRAGLAHERSC